MTQWRSGRTRTGRRVASAVAVAAALLLAAVAAIRFAPAMIASAATGALRDAGFPEGRVTVAGIGLADDWRAIRLEFAADSGELAEAGRRYGIALSGTGTLAGALTIRPGWRGLGIAPDRCLQGRVEALTVAEEAAVLPQGVQLCAPPAGPALFWKWGEAVLAVLVDFPRLDLPGQRLRADAVALDLELADARSRADLLIRSIVQTAKPSDIPMLSAVFRAERTGNGPVRLSGSARDPRSLLVLSATGKHDPESGVGSLTMKTAPIRLKPDGPGLAALSPRIGDMVAGASGTVSAKLSADWTINGLRANGAILLEKFGGRIGPVTLAGVNGTVSLSSLLPPVVPDGQILSIALLDAGLPLTDGVVNFGYGQDGRLDVDRAEWNWAGGILRADPFELSPAKPEGTVTLHGAGIDLAKLLALVEVEGLEAAGTLSGSLPLHISPGSLRIDGGVLESTGPGTLRYDPSNPPVALKGEDGSAGNLLLGALTDFHYDSLRLTMDGQAGGELAVALAVRGANPSFYDGYPVALNLKVSGALDRILRQSLETTRIPDAVRDRMTGFKRKDP